jgi:hypothetical protein
MENLGGALEALERLLGMGAGRGHPSEQRDGCERAEQAEGTGHGGVFS